MLQPTAPGAVTVWPIRPEPFDGGGASLEADAYVGFGTVPVFADAPTELEAAVRACARQGMRVVVTARTAALRERLLGIDPNHVVAEEFVSLPRLLRTCKIVVTHAGAGTVLAALAAGVPLVLAPRGSPSQVRMAAACHEAGVGHCTDTSGIAEAVARVAGEPRYAAAARHAAHEIRSMPTAASVARQLAELAGSR
jgi:UDP:flavonoid glycosyltransferase YjiC (YdhE family)